MDYVIKFAEGFMNGFDGSKIWEGIKQKSKEIVVNACTSSIDAFNCYEYID